MYLGANLEQIRCNGERIGTDLKWGMLSKCVYLLLTSAVFFNTEFGFLDRAVTSAEQINQALAADCAAGPSGRSCSFAANRRSAA